MGYRINVGILLFLIAADLILTVIRPTTADIAGSSAVLDYVLLAAHIVTVLTQAGTIFQLWSGTVLFTAGLLVELLETAWATLILLFFHLIFLVLSWVVRNFASPVSFDVSMSANANMFLYVADLLLAVATWCGLMYSAGALAEKRMYAPYHRDYVEPAGDAFREQRRRMQAFQIQQQAAMIAQQQKQLTAMQQQFQLQQQQQQQRQPSLFQEQQTAGAVPGPRPQVNNLFHGGGPPPGVDVGNGDAGIMQSSGR